MAALYLSVGNLAGMGLGPPAAGYVIQSGMIGSGRVGAALALVAAPTILLGALLLLAALPAHARRAAGRLD
jgi:hypothetical protein